MFLYILWESAAVGNRIIGVWGTNAIVLSVVTLPVPHHCTYISEPGSWLFHH